MFILRMKILLLFLLCQNHKWVLYFIKCFSAYIEIIISSTSFNECGDLHWCVFLMDCVSRIYIFWIWNIIRFILCWIWIAIPLFRMIISVCERLPGNFPSSYCSCQILIKYALLIKWYGGYFIFLFPRVWIIFFL